MASNNKAKYEVQVDIDVKTGKVDATSALKELEAKATRALSELKTQTTELPVKFDISKSKEEVREQYAALQTELDKLAKSTARELSRKSPIAKALHESLKSTSEVVSKDGKIVVDKLREILQRMAAEAGKSTKLTKASPFAQFLELGGKDLDKALVQLENFGKNYQKVLNNIAIQSKQAASTQASSLKKLEEADKLNTERVLASASRREKATQDAVISQKKATHSGYNFGNALDDIAKRSNSATDSIRRYNGEVAKSQLANFSASMGFSQATAKAKLKDRAIPDPTVFGDSFAPDDAKKSYQGFIAGMNEAGRAADATRSKYNLFRDAFKASTPELEAASKGGYSFGKALDDIARRSNSATTSMRAFNKEAEKTKLASFASRMGISQARAKEGKPGPIAVVTPAPENAIKSYRDFAGVLTGVSGNFDFMVSASERSAKRVKSGADAMASGFQKITEASIKAKEAQETLAKGANSASNASLLTAKSARRLESTYDDLQRAISRVASSRGLPATDQVRALEGQKRALLNYIAELQHARAELSKTSKEHSLFNSKLREAKRQLKGTEASLRGPVKSISEFGNSLRLFLRYAVAYKLLSGVSQAFRFLTGSVIELQDALVNIKAVANATESDMVAIENAIKNVATTTKFTTEEIAEAAQTLAQAGVGPAAITATLQAVANFAAATNASLQVAADLISSMKNVFKGLDVEEIADKLTNAVNISKLTPTGLQTIISRLAQTVASFKINADQMLAAITVLSNAGIKASTISTGLRQSILELLSPDAKTLKVLEKRYEAIGSKMSQAAIKTLFSSFSQDANPLLRVINELEKLGIAGSGEKDFQRVFDVRAENVIKALIANKEQFVANTGAINQTGAAAKGAQTQLESLKNAASNLAASISVVASDLSGPLIDGLKDVVEWATNATKSFREMALAQKEATGSSGTGSAAVLGASVAGTQAIRGKGLVASAVQGAVAAGLSLAANSVSGKNQKITEGITNTISSVIEAIGVMALFKKVFGSVGSFNKVLGSIARVKKIVSAGKLSLLSKIVYGGVSKLGLIGLGIAGIYAVYANFFKDKTQEEIIEEIEDRRKNISKKLDDAKNELAKAKATQAKDEKGKQERQLLIGELESLSASISDFAGINIDAITSLRKGVDNAKPLKEEDVREVLDRVYGIRDILQEIALGSKDIGSKSFQEHMEALALLKGVEVDTLDKNAVASWAQRWGDITSTAEGSRKEYLSVYQAALENSTTKANKALISQIESLDDAKRALFFQVIDDFGKAEKFLSGLVFEDQSGALAKAVKDASDVAAQKQVEEFDSLVDAAEAAYGTAQGGEHKNTLKAAILKAAISGNFKLVEAQAESVKDILDGDFIAEAITLAKSAAKAQFEKSVRDSLNKTIRAQDALSSERTGVDLSALNKSSEELQVEQEQAKAKALEQYNTDQAELSNLLSQQADLYQEALGLSEDGLVASEESLAKQKQADALEESIIKAKSKVLKYQEEELDVMQKLSELDKQFLVEEANLKEINRQIAVSKKSQQQDVDKTSELIKKGYLIEKDFLVRRQSFIEENLKRLLGLKDESLDEILDSLNSPGGKELLKDNDVLSGLVKEAIETRTKLNTAEENLRQQLDDLLRKPLDDSLKKAQDKLTKTHSKTENLEGKLNSASDKLRAAREKLAAIYDKEAEDARFFKQLDREFKGEDAQQKGDAKALNERAKKAGTPEEAISLSKEAATLAKSLLSEGKITRRNALRVRKESEQIVKKARDEEKALAQAEIDRRRFEFDQLSLQHAESILSEQALRKSVDKLTVSLNALPGKIQGAVKALRGGSVPVRTGSSGVAEKSLVKGGAAVAEGGKQLSSSEGAWGKVSDLVTKSAEKLTHAAGVITNAAGNAFSGGVVKSGLGSGTSAPSTPTGKGTTSFIDVSNIANVTADETARSNQGQGDIVQAYDNGQISRTVAERLLKELSDSVNPSVRAGLARGGLVSGPGNGKDDKAGLFPLSDNEFVQPSEATKKYGTDFMEQIRTLQLSASQVRSLSGGVPQAPFASANKSGAEVVAGALAKTSGDLRPVNLSIGGAKFAAKASDGDINSFRKALALQALKVGTK